MLPGQILPHCLLMGFMVGVIPVELALRSEGAPGAIDPADARALPACWISRIDGPGTKQRLGLH